MKKAVLFFCCGILGACGGAGITNTSMQAEESMQGTAIEKVRASQNSTSYDPLLDNGSFHSFDPLLGPRAASSEASANTVASAGGVQIGSFGLAENVSKNLNRLREHGYEVQTHSLGRLTALRVLPKSGQTLQSLLADMRGLGYTDAIVLRHN